MRLRRPYLGGFLPYFFILVLPMTPLVLRIIYNAFSSGPNVGVRPSVNEGGAATLNDLRFELLSSLDLFVRAQRTIQFESGTFTRAQGRVPDMLGPVASYYRIEIERATRDSLLVTASGSAQADVVGLENMPETAHDFVSIDERFRVRANFPMPEPPLGYLRALAQSVMMRIAAGASGNLPKRATLEEWEGAFKGHFRYELRTTSSGGRTPVAVPVSEYAMQSTGKTELVFDPGAESLLVWVKNYRSHVFADYSAKSRLRHVYLAQKFYQRESGKFAKDLGELSAAWPGLVALESPASTVRLEILELDSTFGYQAEVGVMSADDQMRNMWSINGYGQLLQINPVEQLFGRLERAQKNLEPNRSVGSSINGNTELEADAISDEVR